MPVKDCITGSPYCPDDKYEELRDSILCKHEQPAGKKETKHNGVPKHNFAKHKGEHTSRFGQLAENILRNRVRHHM